MQRSFVLKIVSEGKSSISGITYPREALQRMVDRYNDNHKLKVGNTDPVSHGVDIMNATHKVENLYLKDGAVYADLKLMYTPAGNALADLDVVLYPHPIMKGSINEDKVVLDNDLVLETIHLLTRDPSK